MKSKLRLIPLICVTFGPSVKEGVTHGVAPFASCGDDAVEADVPMRDPQSGITVSSQSAEDLCTFFCRVEREVAATHGGHREIDLIAELVAADGHRALGPAGFGQFEDQPVADGENGRPANTTAYSFGFAIPTSTPGLRFICRPAVARTNSASLLDHPPSLRYDESDSMVIFNDVLVPWEKVFIHRDPDFDGAVTGETLLFPHVLMQSVVRVVAKSEFLVALSLAIARAPRSTST